MSELEKEYTDRVDFNIVGAEETALASADIEAFGFTDLQHGLVAFDRAGEAKVKMPGHAFGKDEIQSAIETVLATN